MRARASFPIVSVLATGAAAMFAAAPSVATGPPPPPDKVYKVDGIKYAQSTFSFPAGAAFTSIRVPCGKSKWHVLGGGVNVSGGFPPANFLRASNPFDTSEFDGGDPDLVPDDAWNVSFEQDAGGAFDLAVYAVCAKIEGLRYRQREATLDGGDVDEAQVSCKRRHVVGGGFLVAPLSAEIEIDRSAPYDGGDAGSTRDDGWVAHGFHNATPGTMADLRVYAVCIEDGELQYRKRSRAATAMNTTLVFARCRDGAHVVGGGGATNGGHLLDTHPLDSGDAGGAPDDRWGSAVWSDNLATASSYAICLR